jgi:hypothetical protein
VEHRSYQRTETVLRLQWRKKIKGEKLPGGTLLPEVGDRMAVLCSPLFYSINGSSTSCLIRRKYFVNSLKRVLATLFAAVHPAARRTP